MDFLELNGLGLVHDDRSVLPYALDRVDRARGEFGMLREAVEERRGFRTATRPSIRGRG